MMTLRCEHGHKQFQGLRLKRRERSCRRWQLEFCYWINEESRPLGMHQAISRPPSKPWHPRESDFADACSMGVPEACHKLQAGRGWPVVQASRLCRRITRCLSRAQSRSLAASRLSWVCLPLASEMPALTLFPFQYNEVGTRV